MSADPTCPYCNAQPPAGASGRIICPRCGEMFTVPQQPGTNIQQAPSTAVTPLAMHPPVEQPQQTAEPLGAGMKPLLDVLLGIAILLPVGLAIMALLLPFDSRLAMPLRGQDETGVRGFFFSVAVGGALLWTWFFRRHNPLDVLPIPLLWLSVVGVWWVGVFGVGFLLLGVGPLLRAQAGLATLYAILSISAFLWLWFFRVPRSNQATLLFVLANMGILTTTGLALALASQHQRRTNDTELVKHPSRRAALPAYQKADEPANPVAPIRLAALGYLPGGTNVVAAVHVQELLASPVGKDLINRPVKIGGFALSFEGSKEQFGLAVEDIDHLVLGVQLGEGDDIVWTPPLHLVIRTRSPYDADKVRTALGAKRPKSFAAPGGKRSLYAVKVRNLPMQLWLADDVTLVLGVFSDLETVPLRPSEEVSQLPAEVRQVIQERLGAGVPMWLAGHSANFDKTLLPRLLGAWKEVPVLSRLGQVRTFALGFQPDQPARLQGAFRCANEAAAKQIEQQELAPRQKANPETFKFNRDKEWLSVQMKIDLGAEKKKGGKADK